MNGSSDSSDQISRELLVGSERLAMRARRMFRLRAALLTLAAILAAFGLLLLIDGLLRREEFGLRLLFWGTWIGLTATLLYRWIWPAWQFSPTRTQVASWIEAQQADFRGQLVAAIQLAEAAPSDARYGSRGFRDAFLRHWGDHYQLPSWDGYLDWRRLWRAAVCLAAILALLAAGFAIWPWQGRLAAIRLIAPWSSSYWPQADQLVLHDPPKVIAISDSVQIEVIDLNSPLPDDVRLLLRSAEVSRNPDPQESVSTIPTKLVGDMAVGNLPPLETDVEIKAIGGDDTTMQWHRIKVVQPPRLIEHRFLVQPPEYTQQSSRELVGNRIQVLSGSQVQFSGTLSEPVADLRLRLERNDSRLEENAARAPGLRNSGKSALDADSIDPATTSSPEPHTADTQTAWVLKLGEDKSTFQIGGLDGTPARLRQSLRWQLVATTLQGLELELGNWWSINVTEDQPPIIVLQEPDFSQLAPGAVAPLRGRAEDELGLVEITALMKTVTPQSEVKRRSIYTASQKQSAEPILQRTIDFDWQLSADESGNPPQQISMWIEAVDTLGQIGRSRKLIFQLRERNEVLAAIRQRQTELLEKLQQVRDSQVRNARSANRTAKVIQTTDQVRASDVDALSSVSQIQQAIARQLAGESGSLMDDIQQTERLLENNRLQDASLAQEMQQLKQNIKAVIDKSLVDANQQAARAAQTAKEVAATDQPPDARFKNQLADSAAQQSTVATELDKLVDRLARSEARQQVQRDLREILRQQQDLLSTTDALQIQQLSEANSDNLQTQKAELGADQQSLARRLDDLTQRAERIQQNMSDEDAEADPVQMQATAAELIEQQVSQLMRQATEDILEDRLLPASEAQRQAIEALQKTLDQVSTDRAHEHNVEPLSRQLAQALSELVERQQPLVADLLAAKPIDEPGLTSEEMRQREQSLRGLSARQARIRTALGDARGRAEGLPAFEWTLQQAERDMSRAVAAAQRFRIRPEASQAAEDALKKLQRAFEALDSMQGKPGTENPSSEPSSESPQQAAGEDERQLPPLTVLKLLRGLQNDINQQTQAIDSGQEDWDNMARIRRVSELSAQQRALAEQLERVLQELGSNSN